MEKITPVEFKSVEDGQGNTESCVDAMRQFMDDVRTIEEVTFTRFQIEVRGGSKLDDWRNTFIEFIALVGNSITFLSLRWWCEEELSVNQLRQLVFEKMPVLAALHIELCEYEHDDEAPRSHEEPQRNLKRLPNLKQIKIRSSWNSPSPHLVKLVIDVIQYADNLDHISVIRLRYNETHDFNKALMTTLLGFDVSKLKTLKILIRKPSELRSLVKLGQATLRLEKLSLSVVVCCRTSSLKEKKQMTSLLYRFLVSQVPTLQKLKLEFCHVTQDPERDYTVPLSSWKAYGPPFRVPQMQKLQSLKLARSETMPGIDLEFEGGQKAGAYGLSNTFPNLKSLTYQHFEHDFRLQSVRDENLFNDSGKLAHRGVTELTIYANTGNYSRLGPDLFPGVTQYKLRLTGANTRMYGVMGVWSMWPALTKLHLCTHFTRVQGFLFVLGELVAGVHVTMSLMESVHNLKRPITLQRLEMLLKESRHIANPLRNFGTLKNLQEFTLEPLNWDYGRPGLTDIGTYLGLALVGPHLKRITVQGPPHMKNNISAQCREFLQSTLGSDAVINI